ncbi:MAG: hypothetical protein OXH77_11570 [Anaerolineaceae bacterium]|nr:hypothetical protein [Anaerolineaceae bacterium]
MIKLGTVTSQLGYSRVMRNHQFFSPERKPSKRRHRFTRLLGLWTKWEVFNIVFSLKHEQRKEAYDMVRNLMRDSYVEGEVRALYEIFGNDKAKLSYQLDNLQATSPAIGIPDSDITDGKLAYMTLCKRVELFLVRVAKFGAIIAFIILFVLQINNMIP